MYSRHFLACLSVLLGFATGVRAQAQCMSGWEWNQNSLGQDPCTVATLLDGNCRSDPLYSYQKLNATEWYVPPSKTHAGDMTCDCNTVMYSLVMACSTCQGGIAYGWDKWEPACDTVLISKYSWSIPQGTAIPHWAFFNVTTLDKQQFDNSNAQSVGRNPEATASSPTGSSSSKKHNTGAIAGGVVGGVAGLVLILIAVYFASRWWRKNRKQSPEPQWDRPQAVTENQDPYWKAPELNSPTSATFTPSFSTGPTLGSNQPYAPIQNRAVTYVTPIANGGQHQL